MADFRTLRGFEPRIGPAPEPRHLKPHTRTSVLRQRRPMIDTEARAVWDLFLEGHEGDVRAALGELVAALVDSELLQDFDPWHRS